MHENQLNIDEIEDEYIDTMIRLAFKQEEALETQEMIVASKRPFTLEEQAAVENVRRRFIEVLSAKERAQKRENRFLRFQKYAPRILQAAAAVILILAIATPIAIANVASFRSAVMQLLLSFDESKQELHVDFSEDESAAFDVPAEWPGKYYISYIPDGYQISWQSAYKQAAVEYTNAEGNTIYFVEGTSGTSLVSGTEGGQLTYFDIHGRPALVICAEENDNPYFNFTWAVDDRWFNLYNVPMKQDQRQRKKGEHGRIKDKGEDTMNYQHYSPEFKAKIVLQVLQGEKEIRELAQEHSINPNLIRKWKTEFLEKASMVFEDSRKEATKAKRKEERLEKKNEQMLKTIGQLTLERDFIQDAFRRCGLPVPQFNPKDE